MKRTILQWLRSGLMHKTTASPAAAEDPAGDGPTEELPVAEVHAVLGSLRVLEDIVYCEKTCIR